VSGPRHWHNSCIRRATEKDERPHDTTFRKRAGDFCRWTDRRFPAPPGQVGLVGPKADRPFMDWFEKTSKNTALFSD